MYSRTIRLTFCFSSSSAIPSSRFVCTSDRVVPRNDHLLHLLLVPFLHEHPDTRFASTPRFSTIIISIFHYHRVHLIVLLASMLLFFLLVPRGGFHFQSAPFCSTSQTSAIIQCCQTQTQKQHINTGAAPARPASIPCTYMARPGQRFFSRTDSTSSM
jgi:hypothetical protein